jgi:uncharacterized membrane protein affecting hemolysin expression
MEQHNIESKVNYRQALEKIHINTVAQTEDKQTKNEVIRMMMMMMIIIIIIIIIITVIAYYITSWTNTI